MRRFCGVAGLVLVCAAVAPAARPAPGEGTRLTDVFGQANVTFRAGPLDNLGFAAQGLGDVNGDGRDDVSFSTETPHPDTGSIIVLGRAFPREVNLARDRGGTFVVTSRSPGNYVRPAGDVNGDGLDDVFVEDTTSVAVIFGSRTPVDVHTATLGGAGFEIAVPDDIAVEVDKAGDVNGDGRGDLVVSVVQDDGSGYAAVVFGSESPARVALDALGDRGFRVERLCNSVLLEDPEDPDAIGDLPLTFTTAGVGDLNGDGLADVAIASPRTGAIECSAPQRSELLIVHGKRSSSTVDSRAPGASGRLITGPIGAARYVLGPGDVNGDGVADLAFNAKGRIAVFFGRSPPAHLRPPGSDGLEIMGARHHRATPLAAAGDLTGDGRADLIAGNHVVFGRSRPGSISADDLGPRGFRVLRTGSGDAFFGVRHDPGSIAAAGNIGGDGRADLIVSAPSLGPSRANLLFSGGPPLAEIAPFRRFVNLTAGGRLLLRVLCPANASGPCRGRLRLFTRRGTVLRARYRAAAGTSAFVLRRANLAALGRTGSPRAIRAKAVATAVDGAGRRGTTRRTLVIRRASAAGR